MKNNSNNSFIRVENDLGTYSSLPDTADKWQWTVSRLWIRKLLHCSLVNSPRFGETYCHHLRGKSTSLEN